MTHEYFMKQAILQAQIAFESGEVPVGAVLVQNQKIIAKSHNQTELLHDVTAHAEILAITSASTHLQSKYFPKATLYVTLEPCVMCAGALNWAQLGHLVVGASDIKRGYSRVKPEVLHPKTEVTFGILANECELLISEFFQQLRSIKQ